MVRPAAGVVLLIAGGHLEATGHLVGEGFHSRFMSPW
jgi:hypothetical protein